MGEVSLVWKTGNQIQKYISKPQNIVLHFVSHDTEIKNAYVYNYKLKGQTLDSLHSVKFLGVYLFEDLSWTEHVENISNKANNAFGFLPSKGHTKPYSMHNSMRDQYVGGSKSGAVVRTLASHQCGPGSNPGVDTICGLSLLLVLSFTPSGFSPAGLVFPLVKNQHFQIQPGIM